MRALRVCCWTNRWTNCWGSGCSSCCKTRARLIAHIASHNAAPETGNDSKNSSNAAVAPELKAVRDHRATWSRLNMERRLTETLYQVPDKVGPLNTQRLLHHALAVMRDASHAYLQRFMVQIETLLWLEQLNLGAAAPNSSRPAKTKPTR